MNQVFAPGCALSIRRVDDLRKPARHVLTQTLAQTIEILRLHDEVQEPGEALARPADQSSAASPSSFHIPGHIVALDGLVAVFVLVNGIHLSFPYHCPFFQV